jgi:hypothetical protein
MGKSIHRIVLLQTVFAHVKANPRWIVVVVGEEQGAVAMLNLLHALAPADAEHAGRTLLFPNGARVTVTSLLREIDSQDYDVLFAEPPSEIAVAQVVNSPKWHSRAKSVLSMSEREGELVTL